MHPIFAEGENTVNIVELVARALVVYMETTGTDDAEGGITNLFTGFGTPTMGNAKQIANEIKAMIKEKEVVVDGVFRQSRMTVVLSLLTNTMQTKTMYTTSMMKVVTVPFGVTPATGTETQSSLQKTSL
jgi:hypothetical protein